MTGPHPGHPSTGPYRRPPEVRSGPAAGAAPRPSRTELARAAYDAYGKAVGWIAVDGRAMPAWDNLGGQVQTAWRAAAGAVTRLISGT